MKDENPDDDLAVAAVQEIHHIQPPPRGFNKMICRRFDGLHHFARDCQLTGGRKPRIRCYN